MPAPILNAVTLPMPSNEGQTEEIYYKGTAHRMADGTLKREFVTATVRKRRFTLKWAYLTAGQKATVETALGHVEDGTSRSYTSPQGTSYTVVLAEEGQPQWEYVTAAGGVYYYSGELTLEEV